MMACAQSSSKSMKFRGKDYVFPTMPHCDATMVVVSGPMPTKGAGMMHLGTDAADANHAVKSTSATVLAAAEAEMLEGKTIDAAIAAYLRDAREELIADLKVGLQMMIDGGQNVILISGPAPQMLMEICLEILPEALLEYPKAITVALMITSKDIIKPTEHVTSEVVCVANPAPITKTFGSQTYVITHGDPEKLQFNGKPKILSLGSDKADVDYYQQYIKPAGFRRQIEAKMDSSFEYDIVAYLKAARAEIFSTMKNIVDDINTNDEVAANPNKYMLVVFCPGPIMAQEACDKVATMLRVPIVIAHCVL